MRILLDTNVVLRAAFRQDPNFHVVNNDVLRHLEFGDDLFVAPQSLFEAWVVMTRPEFVNGLGLDSSRARLELEALRRAFSVLPDPDGLVDTWLNLCGVHRIQGKPAHDARLVAIMICHEIEAIVTLNPQDFRRFSEIEVLTP